MLRKLDGLKTLAMTTNGLLLSRKLPSLKEAGINLLNVSLDTLVSAKFEFITRRKGFEKVLQGIDLALDLGYTPLKVSNIGFAIWEKIPYFFIIKIAELRGDARIER